VLTHGSRDLAHIAIFATIRSAVLANTLLFVERATVLAVRLQHGAVATGGTSPRSRAGQTFLGLSTHALVVDNRPVQAVTRLTNAFLTRRSTPWVAAVPAHATLGIKFAPVLAKFLRKSAHLAKLSSPKFTATLTLARLLVEHAVVTVILRARTFLKVFALPWTNGFLANTLFHVECATVLARALGLITTILAGINMHACVAHLTSPRGQAVLALARLSIET